MTRRERAVGERPRGACTGSRSAQRGLALAIRQTAIPISGFVVALALPPIVRRRSSAGLRRDRRRVPLRRRGRRRSSCARARARPRLPTSRSACRRSATAASGGSRSAARSSLAPQMCVVGFTVLFLHDQRGHVARRRRLRARRDAGARDRRAASAPAAGRTFARAGSRRCARSRSSACGLVVAHDGAPRRAACRARFRCSSSPACSAMSWNSLSFAAAIELAGPRPQRLGDRPAADDAERPRRRLPGALRRARRRHVVARRLRGRRAVPARRLARPASIARMSGPRAARRDLRDRAASRRLLGGGGRGARARRRLDARGGPRGLA